MLSCRWFNVLLVVGIVGILALPAGFVVNKLLYNHTSRAIGDSLLTLQSRKPPELSAAAWECCVNWAVTAQCNICSSAEHTSYAAMSRFEGELDKLLKKKVDLNTFDRIWDLLAETGPMGQRYVDRFRSQFHAELESRSQ